MTHQQCSGVSSGHIDHALVRQSRVSLHIIHFSTMHNGMRLPVKKVASNTHLFFLSLPLPHHTCSMQDQPCLSSRYSHPFCLSIKDKKGALDKGLQPVWSPAQTTILSQLASMIFPQLEFSSFPVCISSFLLTQRPFLLTLPIPPRFTRPSPMKPPIQHQAVEATFSKVTNIGCCDEPSMEQNNRGSISDRFFLP